MWKNITDKPIKLAVAIVENIDNSENNAPYKNLEKLAEELYNKYSATTIGKISGIENARKLFKSVHIDPTKNRPSSEALLRRAIKQKPLPKINPAVDIGNWCSLEFLLPICVYDYQKIFEPVELRLGKANEKYLAINNREINLENKFVLSDTKGAFGSPITDSYRTAVNNSTKTLVLVIYSHSEMSQDKLEKNLDVFIDRIINFLSGQLKEKFII